MKSTVACVLMVILLCIKYTICSRILALFPHSGKSHHDVYEPYLKQLATSGHQIVVMSHFPQEKPFPNMTDISIKGSVSMPSTLGVSYEHVASRSSIQNAILLSPMANEHCESILSLPQMKQLMNETFDLIITELFNTDCFLGLIQIFNVPFIYFSSSILIPWANDRFGNPDNPSYIPNLFGSYCDKMSFFERLSNTYNTLVDKWIVYPWYFDQPGKSIAEKHLRIPIPPLPEIAKKGSLLLVNSHFSLNRPRPVVPAVVEVGGIHIYKNPQKLPQPPTPTGLMGDAFLLSGFRNTNTSYREVKRYRRDIQDIEEFLNGAEHGVIYFNMGSMIRADTLPPEKRDAFLQAFSELPQRVLWKWETDTLPGKPKNVKIAKWLPQFDILNHPKVRVFLAHGGLLGTIEAVHVGVPMIGIPMYGDQGTNMKMVEAAGMALILQYADITKDNVLKSLRTVLDNSSYTENAKMMSRRFRDRPMSPMDTAIYWTEYVIRHHGAPHMRTAGADLPLYQYLLLDVIAAIVMTFLIVLYIICFILRKLLFFVRGSTKTDQKKKQ